MNFREVEKLMYEDEEFLEWLPILVEENWKEAKPKERLGFFAQFQRLVNKVNDGYPSEVMAVEMDDDCEQHIVFYEDCVYINKMLLERKISPYEILANYIFELAIVDFLILKEDEEFVKTSLGKRILTNVDESLIGEWDNFYGRKSENFFVQPITRESSKITKRILYGLLRYMDENYGMDKYIGNKLSDLMISSFREAKMDEETEKNYKEMVIRSNGKIWEKKTLTELSEYLNNVDYDSMSDEDFYALFNNKIIGVLELPTVTFLLRKFGERELKGYDKAQEALSRYSLGIDEERGLYIDIDNLRIFVNSFQQAFFNYVISLSNIKLAEGLGTGIEDEKFLEDARLCYGYMLELSEGKGHIECDYLPNALPYYEYRNIMVDKVYSKIQAAIEKSRFYKEGKPCMLGGDFSKYEAYLQFAHGKSYEEVKSLQFAKLKEDFLKKTGGKR